MLGRNAIDGRTPEGAEHAAARAPGDTLGAVSAAALAAYEEAVFRALRSGALEPLNPVAHHLQNRVGVTALGKLSALGRKAIDANRAFVDMADIGAGESTMNLQVTVVPTSGGEFALCFARDLTLDYSLRRALVDSRRRYRDFVDICADFTWETGPDGRFAFVAARGALGYTPEVLQAMDPAELLDPASRDANPFQTRHRIEAQEAWLKRPDGRSACVLVSALPLTAIDGRWLGGGWARAGSAATSPTAASAKRRSRGCNIANAS
jgi:PAS domain S-box-containing protein